MRKNSFDQKALVSGPLFHLREALGYMRDSTDESAAEVLMMLPKDDYEKLIIYGIIEKGKITAFGRKLIVYAAQNLDWSEKYLQARLDNVKVRLDKNR